MADNAAPRAREGLLGIGVDPVTMAEAVSRCTSAVERGTYLSVGMVNAAKVVSMRADDRLRGAVTGCGLVLADGQSIVWAGRVLGAPIPERVAGIDLFEELLAEAGRRRYHVYFLGARQSVLDQVLARVRVRYPGLVVAGARDGYFEPGQEAEVAADIRQSGGDACSTTGATACTLAGLAGGVAYGVTVVVHTTVGDSEASAPVTVTPQSAGGSSGPIVSGARATLCVTDSSNSAVNDTKIVIAPCDGSAAQDWTVETDGTVRIHGKCLDVFRSAKASKTPVDLWTCTGGTGQQWQARAGTLVNPASGRCLDDPRQSAAAGTQLRSTPATPAPASSGSSPDPRGWRGRPHLTEQSALPPELPASPQPHRPSLSAPLGPRHRWDGRR